MDKTPTFSSNVQSRRFKRAIDELSVEAAHLRAEHAKPKKDNAHDAKKPVEISFVQMQNKQPVNNPPSEREDVDLKERIDVLEKKVESLTSTLTNLQDAFGDLQNQARLH